MSEQERVMQEMNVCVKKNQNSLTRSRRLQRRRGTTDLAGSKQIDQVER